MKRHRLILCLLSLMPVLFQGCATTPTAQTHVASSRLPKETIETLISEGRGIELRDTLLAPLMTELALQERESDAQIYCARSSEETLVYLLLFGVSESRDAVVLDYDYALAYYYSAYLFVEDGNLQAATNDLEKALQLSPYNAQFLNEFGHIYQMQKAWNRSLDIFKEAEKYAQIYTPEPLRKDEWTRALRGQGFTLIEMQKFAEAKSAFLQCLEIDPHDHRAKNELLYIESILKKV